MKKTFLLSLMLVLSSTLFAQQQASNWHFGNGAGLSFDLDNDTVIGIDSFIGTNEGCSSISDENGNVQFYTDGRSVWSGTDTSPNPVMPNADYIGGTGLLGDPSSTSSGLIVPNPSNPNQYYIFAVDEPHHNNAWAYPNQGPADVNGNPISFYQEIGNNVPANPSVDDGFNNGLTYSLVDMTLRGGLGDVVTTEKNVQLITYDTSDPIQSSYKCSEKITAVASNDCDTIWLITHFIDTFYVFKIDENGVNIDNLGNSIPPVTTTIAPVIALDGYRRNAIGYIKASPDGSKIAICHNSNTDVPGNQGSPPSGSFWVYDFDNTTGIVSNPTQLNSGVSCYGTEFSPDSSKLYLSASGTVTQFDLSNGNQQTTIYNEINGGFLGAMQLGPNGKIYVTNTSNDTRLDVIEDPNLIGNSANYNPGGQALSLGSDANLGLPPFIASFFVETIDIINDPDITINQNELPLCDGDTYTLSAELLPDAVYTWSVDGVVQGTQPVPNEFEVTTNGLYEVLIEFTNGDCNTFEGVADVTYFSNVAATAPANSAPTDVSIDVCDDADNDQEFSFTDFDVQIPNIIGTQNPSDFNIRYYTSLTDATNDENEIAFPFTNTVNNQPIFVRVENRNNPNCFTTTDTNTGDTIQFFLNVFDTPIANPVDPVEECDTEGDTTDGVITFTLSDFDTTILGTGQDAADYTITYHASSMDAMNGTPVLNNTYQNTPFNDEVFYRITNNANTDCFSTNSVLITVNLTPEANDIDLFQCDEDGIPDGRVTFNITEKNDEVTGGNPVFTVEYFLNMTDAMNGTDAIDGSNYENISNPQTLVSKVTDPSSGCYSLAEVILRVSATSANDAYLSLCDTDDEEDGFIDFDLSLADAQVLDGLPAGLDLAYYLTLDDALLEQNPLENEYRNEVAFNQTIFVRVENDNDCYGINEVELEVFTLPNVETEFETLYCLNNFPEPIVINGGVINDVPNNYYYTWSTGETTIEIEVNTPGTYTVEVSNVEGCSKTRTVTVLASNIASIDNVEITDASQNNTVTVIASGEGDYVYALDDPNGPYQVSNVFENVNPGIYTVYVRDENGCGISNELISVVGFPKFFTPNGDNQNDFWQVKGISDQFQPGTVIYIYDRHGKLISEVNPLSSGWDGNYNGNPMPASDYWFSVTLEDGRTFSSHFALKR